MTIQRCRTTLLFIYPCLLIIFMGPNMKHYTKANIGFIIKVSSVN